MTEQILSRLLCGQSVSGQALSEELGVTRAGMETDQPAQGDGV